jgi:flagellar protein FliL
MRMLLPLILLLLGTGAGIGSALFLMPPAPVAEETAEGPCGEAATVEGSIKTAVAVAEPRPQVEREYARMSNQFIVPVVADGRVTSMVVLSISMEVTAGSQEIVFEHEPKLRDVFLQVLFDHANLGGFDGAFTSTPNMRNLRNALRVAARDVLDERITDVLIVDIVRQDN